MVNKNVRTNNNTSFGQRIAVKEGICSKRSSNCCMVQMDKGELAVGVMQWLPSCHGMDITTRMLLFF